MTAAIYWFRNDLRLGDNPAFMQACKEADELLPIYVHPVISEEQTPWGFARISRHRKTFLQESLQDLRVRLSELGSGLLELRGHPLEVFEELRSEFGVTHIYCEQIEAPEELDQVAELRNAGFTVSAVWQSSMLDPQSLPFDLQKLSDVFTQFRQQVEKHQLQFADPIGYPSAVPSLPAFRRSSNDSLKSVPAEAQEIFHGGESTALAHIDQYFERRLPDTYKQTRNQLIGMDYSSKFSPWLALGSASARSIAQTLAAYEARFGANDGTYWLWFELLWRDYFRFIHFKYGKRLYYSKGLTQQSGNLFDHDKFELWISGNTEALLVNAAMRELQATGYLSNRMRQIVASYWIYDMKGDWRAGAAWFESQLIDYDVYSNQGNWLYIAGKGTDPRGGRPFNVAKQTQDHDPEGIYRSRWLG